MLHSLLRHGRSSRAEHQLAASNWLAQCSDRTQQVTLAAGSAAGRCSWHEQLARVTSLARRSDLRHHLRRLKSHASSSKESSLNRKSAQKALPSPKKCSHIRRRAGRRRAHGRLMLERNDHHAISARMPSSLELLLLTLLLLRLPVQASCPLDSGISTQLVTAIAVGRDPPSRFQSLKVLR